MSETVTYDPSDDPVVMSSIQEDEADSLAIGEEMYAQQEQLLAGKYKNAQDLEQAYIELQRKLGNNDDDAEVEEVSEPEESNETVDFLWQINDEFANNGELSEESISKFDSISSLELFQAFQEFQQQSEPTGGADLTDSQVNEVFNAAGGQRQYEQLVGWAAENFSEAEIEAFDNIVDTGNMAAINLALQGLQSRYQDNMGYEGEMIQGKPARSMDVFRSQAELVRAMSDPRYDNDPAYRQDVISKLDRSDLNF